MTLHLYHITRKRGHGRPDVNYIISATQKIVRDRYSRYGLDGNEQYDFNIVDSYTFSTEKDFFAFYIRRYLEIRKNGWYNLSRLNDDLRTELTDEALTRFEDFFDKKISLAEYFDFDKLTASLAAIVDAQVIYCNQQIRTYTNELNILNSLTSILTK